MRHGTSLLLAGFVLAFTPTLRAQTCKASPTMLGLVTNPLIASTVHKHTALFDEYPHANAAGAAPLSQAWADGTRPLWYIELQRGGAEMIEAGVALHNTSMVDEGLREFEWGFAHQDKTTGGFSDSHDAFHSVMIYVIDVARALTVLREAGPQYSQYQSRVQALIPKLHAAALWLLRPEVLSAGREIDKPFTHRRWIAAGALGIAGQISNDAMLIEAAKTFAHEGLSLQQEDGLNPERGGFDVSYQMADVIEATRYYTTLHCDHDAELMAAIRHMIAHACDWETKHLLPDGSLDVTGSSRVLKESNRYGSGMKQINYREITEAFTYTSVITGDARYADVAKQMAASQGWK